MIDALLPWALSSVKTGCLPILNNRNNKKNNEIFLKGSVIPDNRHEDGVN
jgi:hypothetical protein